MILKNCSFANLKHKLDLGRNCKKDRLQNKEKSVNSANKKKTFVFSINFISL